MGPSMFPRRRFAVGCVSVLAMTISSVAQAAVIYVDDDAAAGGDGTSWSTAFNDLQLALAIAQESDEIRVAQGIYKPAPPNGPRTATFYLVNGTTVRGAYAGIGASDPDENDPKKFPTILSGDLNGDDGSGGIWENSFHVVTARTGATLVTIMEGLIITAGNASHYDPPDNRGAGLYCDMDAGLVVLDCVFQNNRGINYVGAYAQSGTQFERCIFRNNSVHYPVSTGYGAGLGAFGSVTVVDCTFENNSAMHGGGGVHASSEATIIQCRFQGNYGEDAGGLYGGGVIIDCTFYNNHALDWGGAARSSGTFVNCRFVNNSSSWRGGAMHFSGTAVNCLFAGNRAYYHQGQGGALYVPFEATLINCTLIGNATTYTSGSPQGGGIYKTGTGNLNIINTIFWDNFDSTGAGELAQIKLLSGAIDIVNSTIQGWTGALGGTGNHGNDPRFIDADGPDDIYGTEDDNPRLLPNSPLIDHGDTSALPPDTFDLDEDGDTTELVPLDLDWLPRIVDETVDVGAYEFQGTPCLADISGDSAVNVQEMLAVINAWGSCVSGQPCNADVTLDGAVTVSDLLLIINNWGMCP